MATAETLAVAIFGHRQILRISRPGQVASLCQFLSTSDQPNPNDKPKRDFGPKLGQILNFDLSVRGQISKF